MLLIRQGQLKLSNTYLGEPISNTLQLHLSCNRLRIYLTGLQHFHVNIYVPTNVPI